MYSFGRRSDTTVLDEPLYAQYLWRFDRGHPMTEEVLASQSSDVDDVVDKVILGPCPTPVLFMKQMAHHLRNMRTDFLGQTENILLTRDPRDMLPSLAEHLPHCDLSDTGLVEQVDLVDAILAEGKRPVVIDAQVLLRNPRRILTDVCERVGIDFEEGMLEWPAGPKPEDGVWAPVWYENVHKSTGFGPYRSKHDPLPRSLEPVLEQAAPLYARLTDYAL